MYFDISMLPYGKASCRTFLLSFLVLRKNTFDHEEVYIWSRAHIWDQNGTWPVLFSPVQNALKTTVVVLHAKDLLFVTYSRLCCWAMHLNSRNCSLGQCCKEVERYSWSLRTPRLRTVHVAMSIVFKFIQSIHKREPLFILTHHHPMEQKLPEWL